MLHALGHPARVQIVEELRQGEKDVNSLKEALDISQSGVSQHLAVLRAHRLVEERRSGRQVFYHLANSQLATWLIVGLSFIGMAEAEGLRDALEGAKELWSVLHPRI